MALAFDQGSGEKKDYGRIDKGTYGARVARIIDMGRQHDTMWNPTTKEQQKLYYEVDEDGKNVTNDDGFSKKSPIVSDSPVIVPKVMVTYETPDETFEYKGEQSPRWIDKVYNITKTGAIAKLAQALVPDATGVSDLAGVACMISVGSTASGKQKVVSANPVMKGMEVPDLANDCVLFDLEAPDLAVFNTLPKFIQDDIKSEMGFNGSPLQRLLGVPAAESKPAAGSKDDAFDDDIPF